MLTADRRFSQQENFKFSPLDNRDSSYKGASQAYVKSGCTTIIYRAYQLVLDLCWVDWILTIPLSDKLFPG